MQKSEIFVGAARLIDVNITAVTRKEFQTLASELRPTLLANATRLLGSEEAAEDVVQDTLLKMWSMGEKLDSYSHPGSLAVVITRNLCLDQLKRPAVSRSMSLEDARDAIDATFPSPHRALTEREALDEVMRMMRTLPDSVQTIMRMRHVEGMETEEIAALTGATVASVRVSLSRGRKQLKKLFENRNYDYTQY